MTKKRRRKENSGILFILVALLICSLFSAFILYRKKEEKKPILDVSPSPISSPSISPITEEETYTLSIPYAKQKASEKEDREENNFVSGWSIQTTDSNVSSSLSYNKIDIDINHSGSSIESSSYYREGIPLEKDCTYTITFNASSTINRKIRVVLSNADTNEIYAMQDYSLSPEESMYSLVYKYEQEKVWNAKLSFYFGKEENMDASIAHSLSIANIRIVSDYAASAIRINQIGYLKDQEKRCVFIYDAGDFFDIVNAETNSIVYTGPIVNKKYYDASNEMNSYGDFSSFTEEGTYYIRSQIGVISNPFTIRDNTYGDLKQDLLKMITYQRCGSDLSNDIAPNLSHPACHTSEATIYGTDKKKDVTGGWHDAGDYGRYVKTGTKAVSDLLLAYLYHPSYFDSSLLEEAKQELDWLFKMQDENGGVFNTVMTPNMSEIVSPEEDNQELLLLFIETSSTADFASTMALASLIYKPIDSSYSEKCLEASKKANEYLNKTKEEEHDNPEGTNGGNYRDDSDLDGRFSAKLALYVATKDTTYLNEAKALYEKDSSIATGITWKNNGGLGRYLFLSCPYAKDEDASFYEEMLSSLKKEADATLSVTNSNSYNISVYEFAWGSNSDVINNGILLSMAYDFTGNLEYLEKAYEQISYVFGKNPLDMCFVTGKGYNSPKNIHNRLAKAKDTLIVGSLVGGPDSYREDIITQDFDGSIPDAKVYADDYESYTTNEVTIYWNSALIHLLARLED